MAQQHYPCQPSGSTLARLVRSIVHPQARLVFDSSKPDGTPRKVLDVSKLNELGWYPTRDIESGVRSTYDWFLSMGDNLRGLESAIAV